MLDQQGLWRRAERAAAGRAARRAGRSTPPPLRRARHRREHVASTSRMHSLFGASKVAADVLAQEYGRYFGMRTGVFRGGCLTGPGPLRRRAARLPRLPRALRRDRHALHGLRLQGQAGARQHPLARPGARASWCFFAAPARGRRLQHRRRSRHSNCSVLEAIAPDRASSPGARSSIALGRGARRRPHLVDQRRPALPARLPGMGLPLRPASRSSRRSSRRPSSGSGRPAERGPPGTGRRRAAAADRPALGRHPGPRRGRQHRRHGAAGARGAGP